MLKCLFGCTTFAFQNWQNNKLNFSGRIEFSKHLPVPLAYPFIPYIIFCSFYLKSGFFVHLLETFTVYHYSLLPDDTYKCINCIGICVHESYVKCIKVNWALSMHEFRDKLYKLLPCIGIIKFNSYESIFRQISLKHI